ncbi:MAG TPA: tetratricopeptide repeat protein [Thermomicrobiales bacterium]|nr:tetratricopeptide repeat protein [Thermomicrobiales bacterium]
MLEQFSRWLRRYQGIEANPIFRLAADVASGRLALNEALDAAQAHHINGRLADGDLLELDAQVEFEAASSMEFALILARLNVAAARAKGFEKVLVDLSLRVADLLERGDQAGEREYHFHEALVVAQRISYASGIRNALNRLARNAFERGDTDAARDYLAQQLGVGREDADTRDEVESALLLADLYVSDGDPSVAHDLYLRASRSARRLGYFHGAVDAMLRQAGIVRDQGDGHAALMVLREASEAADRTVDHRLQAEVAFRTGALYRDLSMPDEAIERFRVTLTLARDAGDLATEARCLEMLSQLEQRAGHSDDAIRHYEEVIALETRLGNRAEVGRSLLALSELHIRAERYHEAERSLEQARDLARQSADAPLSVEAHGLLGMVLGATRREREGIEALLHAVEGSREQGDLRAEARWLIAAGELVLRTGEPDDAVALAARAESVARAMNDDALRAGVYGLVGQVALVNRQMDEAMDAFSSAVASSRAAGRTEDTLRYLPIMSRLAADAGTLEDAVRYLEMAIDEASKAGDFARVCAFERQAARLYGNAGELPDAERHYGRAIGLAEQIGDARLEARSLQGLAALLDTAGELDRAIDLYQRSVSAAVRAGDNRSLATAHFNLGALLVDEERDDEARTHLLRARDEAEALHDFGLADRARTLLQVLAPPSARYDPYESADLSLSETPVRPRVYPGVD